VRVDTRDQVESAIRFARAAEGTVLLDFRVEQEDSVFPMVPAGAALDAMIRRLEPSRLVETSADPG
jgi:acetolactate synthase-1/2/3 large subunit